MKSIMRPRLSPKEDTVDVPPDLDYMECRALSQKTDNTQEPLSNTVPGTPTLA